MLVRKYEVMDANILLNGWLFSLVDFGLNLSHLFFLVSANL